MIVARRSFARPQRTVATSGVLERGGNCFGFMRFVLAAFVIISHSFSIGGFSGEPLDGTNARTLGFVAVFGFFALSGALVGRSAEDATTGRFLWHRVRRIFPAYWVCLLVTAVAIAPLIAIIRGLPLGSVSPSGTPGPYTYFTGNFLLEIRQYGIGNVLKGLPYPEALNGSIWTLTFEFTCYLVVFVVVRVWISAGRRNAVLLLVLATSLVLTVFAWRGQIAPPIVLPLLGTLDGPLLYALWSTFLVSACMALWRDWVPFTPRIVTACGIGFVLSIPLDLFLPYGVLLLPYVILGLGCYLPAFLRPIGTKNDLSYGLYLYGFPAGQILISFSRTFWGAISLMLATLVLATAFAAVSWFLVERWFLRGPGARDPRPSLASAK